MRHRLNISRQIFKYSLRICADTSRTSWNKKHILLTLLLMNECIFVSPLSETDRSSLLKLLHTSCSVSREGNVYISSMKNKMVYNFNIHNIENHIKSIEKDISSLNANTFDSNVHLLVNVNEMRDSIFITEPISADLCMDLCTSKKLRTYSYLEFKKIDPPNNCKGISLNFYVVRSRNNLLCFDLISETLYQDFSCWNLFKDISKNNEMPFYDSWQKLRNDILPGNYYVSSNLTNIFLTPENTPPCCACIGQEQQISVTPSTKLFESHEIKIKDMLNRKMLDSQNKFLALVDILLVMTDDNHFLKGKFHLDRESVLKTISKHFPKYFEYDFNSKLNFFNGTAKTELQFESLMANNKDELIMEKLGVIDYNLYSTDTLKNILEALLESEAAVQFKMGSIRNLEESKHVQWPLFFKDNTKLSTFLSYVQTHLGTITEAECIHLLHYITLKKAELIGQLESIMLTDFPKISWVVPPLVNLHKFSGEVFNMATAKQDNTPLNSNSDIQNDLSNYVIPTNKSNYEKVVEKIKQFNEVLKTSQGDDPNTDPTKIPELIVKDETLIEVKGATTAARQSIDNSIAESTTTSTTLLSNTSATTKSSFTKTSTSIPPSTTSTTILSSTTATTKASFTETTTSIPTATTTTISTTHEPTHIPITVQAPKTTIQSNHFSNNMIPSLIESKEVPTLNMSPDQPAATVETDTAERVSNNVPRNIQSYIVSRFKAMDKNKNNQLTIKELRNYSAFVAVYHKYSKIGMKEFLYQYAENGMSLRLDEFNQLTKRLEKEKANLIEKLWNDPAATTTTTAITPVTTATTTASTTTTTASTTAITVSTTLANAPTPIQTTTDYQSKNDLIIPEPSVTRQRPRSDRRQRNRNRYKRHVLTEFFSDLTGLAPEEEIQALIEEQKTIHLNEEDIKNSILNVSKLEEHLNKNVFNITRDISDLFENDKVVKMNFVKMMKAQSNTDSQMQNLMDSLSYILKLNIKTYSITYNLEVVNNELDRHLDIIERIQQNKHIISPNLFLNVANEAGIRPHFSLNHVTYKIIFQDNTYHVIGKYPVISKRYTYYNLHCIPYYTQSSVYVLEPEPNIAVSIDEKIIDYKSLQTCKRITSDYICDENEIKEYKDTFTCEKELIKLHTSEKTPDNLSTCENIWFHSLEHEIMNKQDYIRRGNIIWITSSIEDTAIYSCKEKNKQYQSVKLEKVGLKKLELQPSCTIETKYLSINYMDKGKVEEIPDDLLPEHLDKLVDGFILSFINSENLTKSVEMIKKDIVDNQKYLTQEKQLVKTMIKDSHEISQNNISGLLLRPMDIDRFTHNNTTHLVTIIWLVITLFILAGVTFCCYITIKCKDCVSLMCCPLISLFKLIMVIYHRCKRSPGEHTYASAFKSELTVKEFTKRYAKAIEKSRNWTLSKTSGDPIFYLNKAIVFKIANSKVYQKNFTTTPPTYDYFCALSDLPATMQLEISLRIQLLQAINDQLKKNENKEQSANQANLPDNEEENESEV